MPASDPGSGAVAGCPFHDGRAVQDVTSLLGTAAQNLAECKLGSDALSRALKVVEQAFDLDPLDPTGAASALLGKTYFHQERYGDAVRHLEAAVAKRPDDTGSKKVLERALRNCETRIERPMMPVELTDCARMTSPPAHVPARAGGQGAASVRSA